jgi:hypothetical protein
MKKIGFYVHFILICLICSYMIQDGIVYMVLTKSSFSKKTVFVFLEEMAAAFQVMIFVCTHFYPIVSCCSKSCKSLLVLDHWSTIRLLRQ